MLPNITPLILTYNEAPNLWRTLVKLTWAKRIIVVDSFSTDETEAICCGFPAVEFVQRKFESFADQCNFGLTLVRTPWVLSMDADYELSDELVTEMEALTDAGVFGYTARFRYCIHGQSLRSTLYPPRTVLYRLDKAHYRSDGHGHRVEIDGPTQMLSGFIKHDDRKPLDRWLGEQNRYAIIEAKYLTETAPGKLNLPDRLRRKIILAPALVFFYTLLVKGLILDGWPGWYYVLQRTYAELLLSLRLIEEKLKR